MNGSGPNLTFQYLRDDDRYLGSAVSSGDVNGDGIGDILGVARATKGVYFDAGRVYVWLSNGINLGNDDITPPTVALEAPDDNTTNTTTNIIDFTYNFIEDSTIATCTLVINDAINMTDTAMINGTAGQNFTTYLPDGEYLWSVNCTDASNNIGNVETRNVIVRLDVNPPVVNLERPEDNTTWTTSSTVSFNYNVSEENVLRNCTLIIDDSIVATSTTMLKDTAGQSFSYGLSNGDYLWSVNCTDENNNIGSGETWNLTVNYNAPPSNPPGGPDNPPIIPTPVVPPVEPQVVPPVVPPVEPPVIPPETLPISQGSTDHGRNTVQQCWNSSSSLTPGEIDSMSYLLNMIPCPDVKAAAPDMKKKMWCNGIEIDMGSLAALKVGFVNGKAEYNINLGGMTGQTIYCPWCSDGVKDYDEEGVDCGGASCPPCGKLEKPASAFVDLKCGDKKCQPGNEYTCPEDCRHLGWTILLIIIILLCLLINTSLWRYYKKKGRLTRNKNIIFSINTIVLRGALLYITTQYVCASAIDCENLMIILALTGITTAIFLIIFEGTSTTEWFKLRYTIMIGSSEYVEAYRNRKEIEKTITEGEKLLREDEYDAAEIIYSTIKPLYNNLPPKHKKKVIGMIRKFYKGIIEKAGGK